MKTIIYNTKEYLIEKLSDGHSAFGHCIKKDEEEIDLLDFVLVFFFIVVGIFCLDYSSGVYNGERETLTYLENIPLFIFPTFTIFSFLFFFFFLFNQKVRRFSPLIIINILVFISFSTISYLLGLFLVIVISLIPFVYIRTTLNIILTCCILILIFSCGMILLPILAYFNII